MKHSRDTTPDVADEKDNDAFEARLRAEMDRRWAATPAMLHSIDARGRIVSVSDAWLAKLGYERDEVIGRPIMDFLTTAARERAMRETMSQLFRVAHLDNFHTRLLKKNGDVIDVLVSATVAEETCGGGRVALTVVTDITHLLETKQRLAVSEARYRSLVEDQSELVSLVSADGELLYANKAYAALYGTPTEEIIGKSVFDFVPEEDRAQVADHLARVCTQRGRVESENRVVLPNGQKRWIAWTNRAISGPDGLFSVIHSVGRDIQDRVDAESRLLVSEARYRFLADHSADMILLVDRNGDRIYVSPASRKLLGFEPEEAMAMRLKDAIHPDDAERVLPVLSANPADTLLTYRMRRKDGGYVWVETTGKTVQIEGGERQRLVIVRDVSARKLAEDRLAEANARLEVLSSEDWLTGLANRRAFDRMLESEYLRAEHEKRTLALLMIDVDRFKAFNDRYGHPAGDDCLRRIAATIAVSIRRPSDIAARYGGEEFAVVLPGVDEPGATCVAANLQRAVRNLGIEHGGSEWGIATLSIGVAAVRPGMEGVTLDRLMKEADQALYFAKNGGRNAIVPASQVNRAPGRATAAA